MPEHPSDDGLTTTAQRSGLDDDPLGMRIRIGVGEVADLPLLIIQQPADTALRYMAFNLWSVLVRHLATMAKCLTPCGVSAGWLPYTSVGV